jgi:serine/threonine protein kinase
VSSCHVWVHRPDDGRWPRNFGRYEVLCRLGAGGMAEVFLARLPQAPLSDGTGEPGLIALKKMLPHLANDVAFVSHFKREATIAVRLDHANIARVLHSGRIGTSWFMAMELVQGETLAQVLERGRRLGRAMPADLVRRVGAAVGLALHFAHELEGPDGTPQKIIHRDVSPQNVMLGYDGSVKLIDFGVASFVESTTRAGSLAGKVRYFSPEQIRRSPVDRRTDIYSLAVTLYEALLGAPAFNGDNEMAIMSAILEGEPPLIADAPPFIVEALRRAMAKDPDQRFPSAQLLAKALMPEVANTGPTGACPPDPSLAGYMRDLMPEGERRWSTIVERVSTGLPFELETSTDADRVSLLAETVPVTLPEARVSSRASAKGAGPWRSFPGRAMAGAAALSLPAIASSTSPRAASIFAGLLALVLVSYGVAIRGATRTPPLTVSSWTLAEPVTASDRTVDTASIAGEPSASVSCLFVARPAAIGSAGRPQAGSTAATHPGRTRHWKRHTKARRGVPESTVGVLAGPRTRRGPGSIADQLEPSPYLVPSL